MWMSVPLMLSQRSLTLSFLFILFSFSALQQWFPPYVFNSLIHSSASFLLLVLLVYFHFRYGIIQFCLFFKSSISWSNISCIFSVCASILFLRSWIIFSTTTWNYFFRKIACLHLVYSSWVYLVPFWEHISSAISFCATSVFASCVLQAVRL